MGKKYKTILLDMDGVVAAFTSAVIKQVNYVMGKNVTIEEVTKVCDWNLEDMWGMSQKEWWQAIDKNPNFWLEIPIFDWGNDLYNDLHQYADEVVILTAPSQNPMCIAHKLTWLKEKMDIAPNFVITGKKKYLLAREDAFLVDDSPKNIQEFVDNGGSGALIPSDWNTPNLTYDDVWSTIEKCI